MGYYNTILVHYELRFQKQEPFEWGLDSTFYETDLSRTLRKTNNC